MPRRAVPALAGAALIFAACGAEERHLAPGVKWSGPGEPWTRALIPRDRLTLDLVDPRDAERLRFLGMATAMDPDGVRCQATSNDPSIFVANPLPFGSLRIEMRADRAGFLEVFWSAAGSPYAFSEARKARLPVIASRELKTYDITFDPPLPADPAGHHFRIDPLDGPGTATIRRIAFLDAHPLPPRGEAPERGRAELGGEWRQAFAVFPGHTLERGLGPGRWRSIRFGAAAAPGSAGAVTVRLQAVESGAADPAGGGATQIPLAEIELPAGAAPSWRDHEVALPPLPAGGRLRFTVTSTAEPVAAIVSEPILVPAGAERPIRPNILLLSIDTLGADAFRDLANDRDSFFGRLERRGLSFRRAVAASSLTHVAHAALLTGRTPPFGDLVWQGGGFQKNRPLADELRRRGYATAAFTGGVVLSEELGFDQGFEWYREEDTLFRPYLERSDLGAILDRALGWLETTGFEPFFLFLHTYEAHGPFYDAASPRAWQPADYFNLRHMRGLLPRAPERLADSLLRLDPALREAPWAEIDPGPPSIARFRAAQRQEIRRVDAALARFFADLEDRELLENTILVVTSDHGEAFGQHGLVEHGLLYEENLAVPLVVAAPGRVEPGASEDLFCMDELPSALLALADGAAPVLGQPALAPEERLCTSYVPGEGWAWRSASGLKLLWRTFLLSENFGHHELFDLASDPGETANLWNESRDLPPALRRAVRRAIRESPGIHLRFEGLDAGDYRLELAGDRARWVDILQAFGVAPRSEGRSTADAWVRDVRLDGDAHFQVLRAVPRGVLDLTLTPLDARRSPIRVRLDLATIGDTPAIVAGRAGEPRAGAWRVGRAAGPGHGDGTPTGFSPESSARLRALGYIR